MTKNSRKTFRQRLNKKAIYLSAIALVAFMAAGLFLVTDGVSVFAQKGDRATRGEITEKEGTPTRVATSGMLSLALDFGEAAEYSVFADRGIVEKNSTIVGKRAAGTDSAQAGRAQNDLLNAFNILENLPCMETRSETRVTNLKNGSYTPGVYCAQTGNLAGQYVLDGNGDPNAIFVFRSSGSISAERDVNFTLVNGAAARNVFFVAGNTASIGEGVNFEAGIIAKNSISVREGAKVSGRIMSVEGKVDMQEASAVLQTGVLQICKTALGGGLNDRIFRFQIGAAIYLVPVGSCSGPITLPAGPVVIDELIDGPTLTGGDWSGRFRLVAVGTDPADALLDANLPLRRVTVNIREGNIQNQTVVEFINTFAVNAIIEICKRAAQDISIATGEPIARTTPVGGDANIRDRDVLAGTLFEFTVDVIENTVFTVPVGMCSGAIQVNVPTAPGPVPQPAIVNVTELAIIDANGEPVYRLDGAPGSLAASTFPSNRLLSIDFNVGLDNSNFLGIPPFFNPGGGVVKAQVIEGGTSNQTTINFWNRSEPGYVKICKVAGPGIPVGTLFGFDVYGREPSNTARTEYVDNGWPAGTAPPTVPFPGSILPGVDTVRRVIVPAGPGPLGFCEFVRFGSPAATGGRVKYIVGSQVLVQEVGANGVAGLPANTTPNLAAPLTGANNDPRAAPGSPIVGIPNGSVGGLPVPPAALQPQTDPLTGVRVGNIRLDAGAAAFVSPATISNAFIQANAICTTTLGNATNNPAGGATLNPNASRPCRSAIFRARRGTTEVEFTNFLFAPTLLKVCKIAGAGVNIGDSYTFNIAIGQVGLGTVVHGTVPPVTVQAGPAASGGFCVFAQGPYTATNTTPPIGTFPVNFPVTVTEVGGNVTAVTSPTGTVTGITTGAGGAGTLLLGFPGGFNEIIFTNGTAAPVQTAFSISGRVMTPEGGGLRNAQVVLTKADGSKISVPTSSMGYYSFDGLANETYNLGVSSRRYRFQAREVELNSSLANVDFTGIE